MNNIICKDLKDRYKTRFCFPRFSAENLTQLLALLVFLSCSFEHFSKDHSNQIIIANLSDYYFCQKWKRLFFLRPFCIIFTDFSLADSFEKIPFFSYEILLPLKAGQLVSALNECYDLKNFLWPFVLHLGDVSSDAKKLAEEACFFHL